MSSGSDGVLQGGASRVVRSQPARPAGPETKLMASRAMAYRSAWAASGVNRARARLRARDAARAAPARGPARDAPGRVTVAAASPSGRASGPLVVRALRRSPSSPSARWPGSAPSRVMPGRGQRQRDDLVDHPHVGVPGHHRDDLTRRRRPPRRPCRSGSRARRPCRAARPPPASGAPGCWRSCGNGMCTSTWVSAPGPVRHHLRADQQLTALLQRVVEPLPLGPGVLCAGLLAQRLQHRLHRGGAFRGQVAADHARAAERGPDLHVPVVEPVIIGVRPLRRATSPARPRR